MMKKMNMLSTPFAHDLSSTHGQIPQYFSWDFQNMSSNISFYIDGDIFKGIEDKRSEFKFLWTLESPYFNNNVFDHIENNLDKVINEYDLIFTYNDSLLNKSDKFKWVPAMGSWIKSPEIPKKTKLVSMITSSKNQTPNQQYRVNFASKYINIIDVFGRPFNPINLKENGLRDYMFSVCIENATIDSYFTEKILDCFAMGVIPIYKGTKKISEHFNSDGIIFLDGQKKLDLSEDLYLSKMSSILENFEKVKKYMIPEDYIYENYLQKYL